MADEPQQRRGLLTFTSVRNVDRTSKRNPGTTLRLPTKAVTFHFISKAAIIPIVLDPRLQPDRLPAWPECIDLPKSEPPAGIGQQKPLEQLDQRL
mmetsp:Transcript_34952/g.47520  ORF Transcript_34952/g.47520 Transcript_34952/m.47520 type:complete len:95 (+) Transcript_34952:437-721(+)